MDKLCRKQNLWQNPALAYATLNFILGYKKGKVIALLMPFADALKSTADWYVQLLAESLGKKYLRKVRILPGGIETWQRDEKKLACVGRTPVACLGTTDLHSIQQNNVEGMNNKTVTFIRIEKFATDLHIPKGKEIVSGHSYAGLLKLAQEATEWSLTKECRPNCTISLDRLDGKNWAALLYFFQMATAYEGELLNVNAYDQPGVEGYKNYMHYKLGDPLVSKEFVKSVQKSAFKKNPNFILKT
jgi:glucose-6-phosphate isomerase